jgi:hypothetical protein
VQGRVYRTGMDWAFGSTCHATRRPDSVGSVNRVGSTRRAAEEDLTDLLGEIRTDVVAGTGTNNLENWLNEWLVAIKPSAPEHLLALLDRRQ